MRRPPVLEDVVEEYFDELEFLWEHREANLRTPDWTHEDLAEHEARAEAHLDGIRVAGEVGYDLATRRLLAGDPFATCVAALVLAEVERGCAQIRDALPEAEGDTLDGLRIALRHGALEPFEASLSALLAAPDAHRAASALDVLAFHRRGVSVPGHLLGAEDGEVAGLALGAAGRLGTLTESDVARHTAGPEAAVRRAAVEAAARQGVSGLLPHLRAAATRSVDPDPVACYYVGVLGEASDAPALQALASAAADEAIRHAAVEALGALGAPEAMPVVIELMADDALGEVATAAYRRVTHAPDIEGERPFPPPEVAEGEDESEELPPDPEKAAADWSARQGTMPAGTRWQGGVPIPPDGFPAEFHQLDLRTRYDVFLALRSRFGARAPDLELEARAALQTAPIGGSR